MEVNAEEYHCIIDTAAKLVMEAINRYLENM